MNAMRDIAYEPTYDIDAVLQERGERMRDDVLHRAGELLVQLLEERRSRSAKGLARSTTPGDWSPRYNKLMAELGRVDAELHARPDTLLGTLRFVQRVRAKRAQEIGEHVGSPIRHLAREE